MQEQQRPRFLGFRFPWPAAPRVQTIAAQAPRPAAPPPPPPPPRPAVRQASPAQLNPPQPTSQPFQSMFQRLPRPPQRLANSGTQIPKPRAEVDPQPAPRRLTASRESGDGSVSIDHSQFVAESKERVVNETVKQEKTEDQAHHQPVRKPITQLLTASATQTKELRTLAQQPKQKEHKQETSDNTNTVSSSTKQVNTDGPKVRQKQTDPHNIKEVRNDISKFVHKLAPVHINHHIHEQPLSIVTLAGKNSGASMKLDSGPAKKEESVHIQHGHKLQAEETTTDAGESFKGRSEDHMTEEDQAMKAYVDNNVQSINNSIIFDSCVAGRNPGVHLVISQGNESSNPQTSKVEFQLDNPEKPPQLHGEEQK